MNDMRQCNGVCDRDKVKLIKKPIYTFQDYCRECEVYYHKGKFHACPCCKCMVRVKAHHKKHLNSTNSIVEHGELSISVLHTNGFPKGIL